MSTTAWQAASRIHSCSNGSGRHWFRNATSQKCFLCSGGSNKQPRRRRGKKLPLRPTKKDRIRSLEQTKQSQQDLLFEMPSMSNMTDMNKVGEALERGLTQAQTFVYNFWRQDHNKGPRPERRGPVMDGRWWFWNIMLMSLPGLMIAAYCQFVAMPEMQELLGKLNEEQRARILGGTLAETDVFEMETTDVQRLQESVNEEITNHADGDVTLLALKHRLDALESELRKKDRQVDHLRRYQLERMQQSGIQNRAEDKMIAEWSSQGKSPADDDGEDISDATSLTERMKMAVMEGLGENVEAKKEVIVSFGRESIDYGRRLLFGEEKSEPPSPLPPQAAPSTSTNPKQDDTSVIKAAADAASHSNQGAQTVSSTISSSDPVEMAQAAKVAANAAVEASRAAQSAADHAVVVTSQGKPNSQQGFLMRQWNKLFRRVNDRTDEHSTDANHKPSNRSADE